MVPYASFLRSMQVFRIICDFCPLHSERDNHADSCHCLLSISSTLAVRCETLLEPLCQIYREECCHNAQRNAHTQKAKCKVPTSNETNYQTGNCHSAAHGNHSRFLPNSSLNCKGLFADPGRQLCVINHIEPGTILSQNWSQVHVFDSSADPERESAETDPKKVGSDPHTSSHAHNCDHDILYRCKLLFFAQFGTKRVESVSEKEWECGYDKTHKHRTEMSKN